MPRLSDYDVLIFDCDGVIFNSNQLKIEAMRQALTLSGLFTDEQTDFCVQYFAENFGLSRFYHVKRFVEFVLALEGDRKQSAYTQVLEGYSRQCFELYLKADFADHILITLDAQSAPCYVASGSDEEELRLVFDAREISPFFVEVNGSPTKKADIVQKICVAHPNDKILMIGDAVSDFESADINGIDFLFYAPLSNVQDRMLRLAADKGFDVCWDFLEVC